MYELRCVSILIKFEMYIYCAILQTYDRQPIFVNTTFFNILEQRQIFRIFLRYYLNSIKTVYHI